MAATGYDWGSWTYAKDSAGGDWDGNDTAAIIDTGSCTSNTFISMDIIAACEVGIQIGDPGGAVDGVVTIYVLGDGGGMGDEEITANVGSPWSFTLTPVNGNIVYKRFSVDPGSYGTFKIAIANECGQTVATYVKYRTATVPAAS